MTTSTNMFLLQVHGTPKTNEGGVNHYGYELQ